MGVEYSAYYLRLGQLEQFLLRSYELGMSARRDVASSPTDFAVPTVKKAAKSGFNRRIFYIFSAMATTIAFLHIYYSAYVVHSDINLGGDAQDKHLAVGDPKNLVGHAKKTKKPRQRVIAARRDVALPPSPVVTTSPLDNFVPPKPAPRRTSPRPHSKSVANDALKKSSASPSTPAAVVKPSSLMGFVGQGGKFPILMLAKNRPDQLRLTFRSLLSVSGVNNANVFMAQDGHDISVANVAKLFNVSFEQHQQKPAYGAPWEIGATRIARHYKWSLSHFFNHVDTVSPAVIVIEDDLRFSPDFYDYFHNIVEVLDKDKSVWIASAWNDNGFNTLVHDPYRLLRTGFFPGLGWLITRKLYKLELERKWPDRHWDHWLRQQQQHHDREVVYPEVPRVFHAGIKGTFMEKRTHEKYFARIDTNRDGNIKWSNNPTARAAIKDAMIDNYEANLIRNIKNARTFSSFSDIDKVDPGQVLAIWVRANVAPNRKDFERISPFFGIWHEHQRGAHCGVHEFWWCKPGSAERIHVVLINIHPSVGKCVYTIHKPPSAVPVDAGIWRSPQARQYDCNRDKPLPAPWENVHETSSSKINNK